MDTVNKSKQHFEVRSVKPQDITSIVRLHTEAFGQTHGYSLSKLGPNFLEQIFYRINLDNPDFHVDVACYRSEIAGFNLYITNRHKVFRRTVRNHLWRLVMLMIRFIMQHPQSLIYFLSNLRYIGGEKIPGLEKADAHHLAFFIKPEYRSKNFKNKTDIFVAKELYEFMELVMKRRGSKTLYGAMSTNNVPINKFYQNLGSQLVGTYKAQGDVLNYWIKDLI